MIGTTVVAVSPAEFTAVLAGPAVLIALCVGFVIGRWKGH